MLRPLAEAAKGARLAAGRKQIEIAVAAGVSHSVISRFERAKGWPLNPDRIVEAYAEECGVEPLAIWRDAVDRLRADADDRG